jgi:hypothetical protein
MHIYGNSARNAGSWWYQTQGPIWNWDQGLEHDEDACNYLNILKKHLVNE